MKLWMRLAAALTVGAVVPLLLTGYFAAYTADRQTQLANERALTRDAIGAATFVETWTADQQQLVSGWTLPFRMGSLSAPMQSNLLGAVLRANAAVVAVALVDSDGVAVVPPQGASAELGAGRVTAGPERASALVSRVPLSAALAARHDLQPGIVLGDPWWPDGSAAPSVVVGVAGPWEGDAIVLGAELTLAPIAELLREQQSREHGVVVLSAGGEVLVGGDSVLFDQERLRTKALGAGPDHTTTFAYVTGDGTSVTGAAAVTPTLEWTVLVLEPSEVAGRSSAIIWRATLSVVVVAVLLAVAIALVFGRSLSLPVAALRDAALAVANGDLERRVDITRGDEIGDLASAFNRMGERLTADQARIRLQQAEIEAFNAELQHRVDERTRELREAQARLVQAGQLAAVADVTAGMAHELNNPLAAILGLAQVARRRAAATPLEPTLSRIEEQAARCREVLAALLRFGGTEVDSGPDAVVRIGSLVASAVALVQGAVRPRGVVLALSDCDPELCVRVDPLRAERALAQVLHAIAFGLPSGFRIDVSVARRGSDVCIGCAATSEAGLALSSDARKASAARLWMGRNWLDQLGGSLVEDGHGWVVSLPVAVP
jgi:two-component system NtrC family sensor kinase